MKVLVSFPLCLWALFVFVSCAENRCSVTLSDNYYITDSEVPSIPVSDVDEFSVLNYSDVYDSIKMVKLESHPDAIIGRVSKVELLKNGKFLIFDNAQAGIFVFDSEGHFLNTVGCKGNGDKEYITPEVVVYDNFNDEVVVWDHNKKNLMFYRVDGSYLRKTELPWYIGTFYILDADHIALFMNNADETDDEKGFNIRIINRDGELVFAGMPYDKQLSDLNPACKSSFSFCEGRLFCNPPYSSVVYEIKTDSVIPCYSLDFGENAIPVEWYGTVSNREMTEKLDQHPDLVFCSAFYETSDYYLMNVVKRRLINLYLSPKNHTGKRLCATSLFNDMYGLVGASQIQDVKGNQVVSVLYADQFEPYKEILDRISGNESIAKVIVDELYGETLLSFFRKDDKLERIRKHILSVPLQVSREEKDFIMSVGRDDNPILQVGVLK